MTAGTGGWTARITVRRPDAGSAERIERALAPEASREVPRSHARMSRPSEREIALDVDADDTGALRAALNAYLGWVRLAFEAEEIAQESSRAAAGAR